MTQGWSVRLDPDKGLVIDNSSGTLTVATGGGIVTGYNFDQVRRLVLRRRFLG